MNRLYIYIQWKAIARQMGLSVQTIAKYSKEDGDINYLAMERYADYCGVTMNTALKYCEEAFQQFLRTNDLTEDQVIEAMQAKLNKRYDELITAVVKYKEEDTSDDDELHRLIYQYIDARIAYLEKLEENLTAIVKGEADVELSTMLTEYSDKSYEFLLEIFSIMKQMPPVLEMHRWQDGCEYELIFEIDVALGDSLKFARYYNKAKKFEIFKNACKKIYGHG